MATTRLRKAFRYPDDLDHEPIHEGLDEQEQEQLIRRLQAQHDTGNAKYSVAFAMLPLLSAVVFLPSLLLPSSSLYERFLGLVSVASLGATAYAMRAFGVALPARSLKGKMPVPDASARRWLLPVNTACCGFLCLVYALIDPESLRNTSPELYLVPAAMLATILVTLKIMTSVDPSLLEDLRYEYKGP